MTGLDLVRSCVAHLTSAMYGFWTLAMLAQPAFEVRMQRHGVEGTLL